MALTELQRVICGILAENRIASGESYVAGGVARNELIAASRLSADVDLFFGLVLHPFDLATNKMLALVGRLEVRDWVDLIATAERLQPLGYLAWAACAKDPGFGPAAIIEAAARSGRYSAEEARLLSFAESPPDAAALALGWHRILESGREVVSLLPPEEVGACVLGPSGELFTGSPADLDRALRERKIAFHQGRIRGALPRFLP